MAYAYQGMGYPVQPVTDWATLPPGFRMGAGVTLESPSGTIKAVCIKHDPEGGNPAWTYRFLRKDGSGLGTMACFGANPRNDLTIGFRHASSNLRKKRDAEGI